MVLRVKVEWKLEKSGIRSSRLISLQKKNREATSPAFGLLLRTDDIYNNDSNRVQGSRYLNTVKWLSLFYPVLLRRQAITVA